jgi:hypothetical protein
LLKVALKTKNLIWIFIWFSIFIFIVITCVYLSVFLTIKSRNHLGKVSLNSYNYTNGSVSFWIHSNYLAFLN